MKACFLLASIICAASLSALTIVMATGRVPAGEAASSDTTAFATKPGYHMTEGAAEANLNKLFQSLEEVRSTYESRIASLSEQEEKSRAARELLVSLRGEVQELNKQLEDKLVQIKIDEQKNLKQLSKLYTEMDTDRAAEVLRGMNNERAAIIISMMPTRQAAAIMDATVSAGEDGASNAIEWADIIRRIEDTRSNRT